jgi:hypothetical protein
MSTRDKPLLSIRTGSTSPPLPLPALAVPRSWMSRPEPSGWRCGRMTASRAGRSPRIVPGVHRYGPMGRGASCLLHERRDVKLPHRSLRVHLSRRRGARNLSVEREWRDLATAGREVPGRYRQPQSRRSSTTTTTSCSVEWTTTPKSREARWLTTPTIRRLDRSVFYTRRLVHLHDSD